MESFEVTLPPREKFYIKTFGCQMNVADTERMATLLSEQGLDSTEDPEEADVIIVNGCSVREKAVHKAVSFLGEIKVLKPSADYNGESYKKIPKKRLRAEPLIGLGGCVGQLEKSKLFERAPYLDFVFGPDAIDQLPEIVFRSRSGERRILQTEFDPAMTFSTVTKVMPRQAQAYVNIMKGCDKYCTYCIVPFTRGKEKSRTIDEVLDDVASLVKKGVREVTLLGQNVNSFGKGNANTAQRQPLELHNKIGKVGPKAGDENFPQLLRAMEADPRLKNLKRIRYVSSHPLDFSDELIECYAAPEAGGLSKLAHHLHLPVQSGSNRILQKMGRHHQIEGYIAQMDRLREICPEVGISTDLIVGFPGETEEDFQDTCRLLERVRYDIVYAYAYSPRPGTRASKMVDDVPDSEKNRRLNHLIDLQRKVGEAGFRRQVGTECEVLIEGDAKNQALAEGRPGKMYMGRTSSNRVVNVYADGSRDLKGQYLRVKILSAGPLSLGGEVIHDASFAEATV